MTRKRKRLPQITDEKQDSPCDDHQEYQPSCVICMQPYDNRTFLQPCFHSFCFSCIRQWINITAHCPLCKITITSLVYNINDEENTFQEYRLSDKSANGKHYPPVRPLPPTVQEKRHDLRKRIYLEPIHASAYPPPLPNLKHVQVLKPEHIPRASVFIQRELAILLDQPIDAVLLEIITDLLLMPQKKNKTTMDDANLEIELSEWIGSRQASRRFITELMAFVRSGLSYPNFLKRTEYNVDSPE